MPDVRDELTLTPAVRAQLREAMIKGKRMIVELEAKAATHAAPACAFAYCPIDQPGPPDGVPMSSVRTVA